MFQPFHAHYKNKYPGCRISTSENSFDVHSASGEHLIALRKNGAGQLQDHSKEFGCSEVHDMSPIPKDARVYKLYADGVVGKSEEFEQRKAYVAKHVKECPIKGYAKVPSIEEGGIKEEAVVSEESSPEVTAPEKKKRAKKKS